MFGNMERIERIQQMEAHFDIASEAVSKLYEAMRRYKKAQPSIKALKDYYDNGEWVEDFEADEKGLLPKDLKRGVLSEDGLWDLLADDNDLKKLLKQR